MVLPRVQDVEYSVSHHPGATKGDKGWCALGPHWGCIGGALGVLLWVLKAWKRGPHLLYSGCLLFHTMQHQYNINTSPMQRQCNRFLITQRDQENPNSDIRVAPVSDPTAQTVRPETA